MQASPQQPPDPASPAVPVGPPPATQAVPLAAASAAPIDGAPAIADDGDLIEKEWVMQVKQLATATAGDPYEQNKRFSQIKADYMQKRYGKSIKSED